MIVTTPDHGWAWIVVVGDFGAHCLSGYFFYTIGLIQMILIENFKSSILETSWIAGVFLSLILFAEMLPTSPDKGWAWFVLAGSVRVHIIMGYCAYASGMIHIALLENFNGDLLTTTGISALFLALISGSEMSPTSSNKGWAWFVLVGSVGEHIVMGYCAYASGMIHIALLENFNADLLTTTWISALFLALMTGSGPIASTIINRFSCRVAMILGSLMLSTGLVLTGFVEDIKWTYLTFGILSGIGLGLCYNTGLIVIAFNFEQKRNMACGIAISGGGIGPFILTPVFQFIYEKYNYSGFFLLLGGLALQNCVFGATFRPSKTELAMKTANSNRKERLCDSVSSYMEIVRSGSMLCLCLGFFLANISTYLLYIHYPEFCLHTKSSKMEVSIFLSIAGMSGCFTRVLFGMANNSHNIDELIMLFGVFSLLGLGTIIFPLFSSYTTAKVMFASLLGGYSGCCWAVVNTIVINILGHEKLAHGVGYLMVYVGVGTFIGPPLAGFIINYGGTYGDSFTVAGILLIMGAFSCLCSTMCRRAVDTKANIGDLELTVTAEENRQTILVNNRTEENDSFLLKK